MDFEAPPAVRAAIEKRAAHNLYGYDRPPEGYNDAVSGWYAARHNWQLADDWIVPTSGVVHALHLAIQALSTPGDEVVIQPPVYHPFAQSVLNSGRQLVTSPLRRLDNSYEIDFDDLKEKLSRPEVKLLIICNPHNPVGKVFTRDELTKVGELALKYGVIVISDEIHGDLIIGEKPYTPFASISDSFAQNSVTCTAPSKTFNLAGLATSNVIIPNAVLRGKFENFAHNLGIHGGSLYGFIACAAAYREGADWLDALLSYIKGNARFVEDCLAENLPSLTAYPLEGTYLQWIDFSKLGLPDEKLDEFLREKAGLWTSPGIQFGKEGSGFVRLNLATQRAALKHALDKLAAAAHAI
jgi:cystathionine beta-lyase